MSAGTDSRVIGNGELVCGGAFEGVIARAVTVEDVLALVSRDLSDTVLLTDQPSATAFAPILPRIRGVLCMGGGPATHLAIVSRGLGLACVMKLSLDEPLRDGDRVSVDNAGAVQRR